MKTEALDFRNLDDLIFENRNKDYGAYYIRKSYSKSMMTGLGFSVSIACLLVILPQLSLFGDEQSVLPLVPEVIHEISIGPPPAIQPPPAKQTPPPTATKPSVNQNLPPQVTTRQVETVIPETDVITPISDGIGEDGGEASPSFTGTGTGIIESLPIEPTAPIDFAEVMPEYEGGAMAMMKFIVKNTHFPSSARRLGTQGTVFVSFVVDTEGNVKDVKVVRGISAECDKEAARVISKMRGWKAGMQNHRAVSVRMTLPIKFQLQEI